MGASGFRGAFFVLREKEEDLTQRARRRSTEGTEKGNGERGKKRFAEEGAENWKEERGRKLVAGVPPLRGPTRWNAREEKIGPLRSG